MSQTVPVLHSSLSDFQQHKFHHQLAVIFYPMLKDLFNTFQLQKIFMVRYGCKISLVVFGNAMVVPMEIVVPLFLSFVTPA